MKALKTKSSLWVLLLVLSTVIFSVPSCGGGGGGSESSAPEIGEVISGTIVDVSVANTAYVETLAILTGETAGFESQTGLNDFPLGSFRRADKTLVAEPTSEQLNNLNITTSSNFSGFDETYKFDLSSEISNDGSIAFNGIT